MVKPDQLIVRSLVFYAGVSGVTVVRTSDGREGKRQNRPASPSGSD